MKGRKLKRISLRGHGALRPLWLDIDYWFILPRCQWKIIWFAKGRKEFDRCVSL